MTQYLVDTNVLVRFLLGDHPSLSPESRKLFTEAHRGGCSLVLTELVVAETVWVLSSHYKIGSSEIAKCLKKVCTMAGIIVERKELLLDALNRYEKTGVDFTDCHLASWAVQKGFAVASFDKDFKNFSDVDTMKWDS